MSLRLVIDANVVRAAGETDHDTSTACRECLRVVLESDHRAVLSPELEEEWRRHASALSRGWWTKLTEQDRIVDLETGQDDGLAEKMRAALPLNRWHTAKKDLHLVVAAMTTDRIIIACDDNARHTFVAACEAVEQLRDLRWVNPVKDSTMLLRWLRGEAEAPLHWNLAPRAKAPDRRSHRRNPSHETHHVHRRQR